MLAHFSTCKFIWLITRTTWIKTRPCTFAILAGAKQFIPAFQIYHSFHHFHVLTKVMGHSHWQNNPPGGSSSSCIRPSFPQMQHNHHSLVPLTHITWNAHFFTERDKVALLYETMVMKAFYKGVAWLEQNTSLFLCRRNSRSEKQNKGHVDWA